MCEDDDSIIPDPITIESRIRDLTDELKLLRRLHKLSREYYSPGKTPVRPVNPRDAISKIFCDAAASDAGDDAPMLPGFIKGNAP